ncbi:MAG TPA: HAMP domain-containing sensor histidine kinase [Mycobacteriales bacterium]|jgi:two-component system sensor histidine kinase BaeS|nr:HAMP domain-containing sensor histidine kinase [Mycobacteriales bacterium]
MRRRHSLLVRLLVMCVAIATCSIAATAWIASISTSSAIQHRYTSNLSSDSLILDRLVGFAATHKTWAGVDPTVMSLAKRTGREITLATSEGGLLASSAVEPTVPTDGTPSAVVNPLAVATGGDTSSSDGIDLRAVGPFELTAGEKRYLRSVAEHVVSCLTGGQPSTLPTSKVSYAPPPAVGSVESAPVEAPVSVTGGVGASGANSDATGEPTSGTGSPSGSGELQVSTLPNGRSALSEDIMSKGSSCGSAALRRATATELRASKQLVRLINTCLSTKPDSPYVLVGSNAIDNKGGLIGLEDPSWLSDQIATAAAVEPRLSECVETARREQLTPYVAPPAQLYISDAAPTAAKAGITRQGLWRIALAAAAILALTIAVCAFAATRLVRPLRALTTAAGRVGAGDRSARVRPPRGGEIGELGVAFNRMAAELGEAETRRKDMVSDVAHELRTPLGNIRGWLEAVQDGLAEPDPELIASLLEESGLLQHVIEDLQDLALADAGKLVFHPELVDVSAFVVQAVGAHRVEAADRGVTIEIDCPAPVEISTDPNRLHQILNNLVSNAVRYTPAGGTVIVRAWVGAGAVRIEVSDTGVGISAEDLPKVFSRFWRAERSRGRAGGGSGLGLAITRHLVEAQGGTITVRSEVGVGSVFAVRLPDRA